MFKAYEGFRPHEGDPSSLLRIFHALKLVLQSFRPHEGNPSSLPIATGIYNTEREFPSPRRGPIFSTMTACAVRDLHSFRPHEGDPSSLHTINKICVMCRCRFRPHEGDPSSLQMNFIPLNCFF